MAKSQTRRTFLRTAPFAAAVTLPLANSLLHASGSQTAADIPTPVPYQLFPAQDLAGIVSTLQTTPAAKEIVGGKDLAISITLSAEANKTAKEFELHEHRDHLFQVIDGSTRYQIGGTLKDARQTKPGEYLAPAADGFKEITLNKGDMLVIPRNTPHRRITDGKVSLLLVNTTPPA